MPTLKVTIDDIEVNDNGDRSGKGELYWEFKANNSVIETRSRNNPDKRRDGETIRIGDSATISLGNKETLVVSGSVSEQDGVLSGDDETDRFNDEYRSPNWGIGNHRIHLQDKKLDVNVNYRIERI